MKLQNQWKRLAIGGAAALALTAGTLWTMDTVYAASSGESWTAAVSQQVMEFAGRGGHGPNGGRGMGGPGMRGEGALLGDQQQYLADALGITVEELQSAHESVRDAIIDQAVADGTLTPEQADQLKAGERLRIPGLRMKGGPDMAGDVDRDALLADALGITVEELDAARNTARDAAIADALANGTVTQEQVDRMKAQQAFHEYLHTQYADERPTATIADLIQEAADAGALTEAQADLLLSGGPMGPGGHGGHGGHGGFREGGKGGMRGPGMDGPQGPNGAVPDGSQQNQNDDTQQSSADSPA